MESGFYHNQIIKSADCSSEEILNIIDAIPDMIFVMHRDGTILEIHGEDPKKLIVPADQLVGTSIKDCFEEEEFHRHIKMYEHCISRKESGIIEFSLFIDNRKQFFESRIKPLDDERLLTIVRDISSQKQLLKAHEDELAYRKFLFDNDNNGLVILNNDHKVVDVNPQFCLMTGYSADELKTMYTWDFDALSTKQNILEIFDNKHDLNLTFASRHNRKDGSNYEVEVSAISFFLQGERFVYCSCRDITDRKLSEEAIRKSNQRLESLLKISRHITSTINQEEIMQMIVDNAIKIMGLDTGAVYLKNNDATIKLSATSPALPGNFPDDLRIALLSDHPHIGKAMETGKHVLMANSASTKLTPEEQKVIDLRKLKTNLYLPIRIRKKTIGVLILSSSEEPKAFTSEELNLLQGFANQAAHIIDNVRNYAELKKHAIELEQQIKQREKAERELIVAKEKAEESNRLKTAFINNISHEIRTPLNGILGFGGLIIEDDLPQGEKQRYFKVLEQSTIRLQQTITDIMDISEVTAESIKPGKNNVHVVSLMKELLESTEKACSSKNILISLDIPNQHKDLILKSDKELLIKIMKQLLDNAEKFTDSGRIILGYDVHGEWVQFHVKDTGQGIDDEKLEVIFEPFMQEDLSVTRGHEGSGLGLSIARGLVKLLGGELWAASEKGAGSTFFFTLPYLPAEAKDEPKEAASVTSEKSGKNLILIAEDEESNYMLLKTVAERAGFSTLHAIHGAEAVELCQQYPEIGLILMDIKMPVMNGLEATQKIKAFRPDLPIIALTAHAQTGDRQRMLDAGCDEYMAKPVNLDKLNALIKRMIT